MEELAQDSSFFNTLSSVKSQVIRSNVEESRRNLSRKKTVRSPERKQSVKLAALTQDDKDTLDLYKRTLYAINSHPEYAEDKVKLVKKALQVSDSAHKDIENSLLQEQAPEWRIHVTVCQAQKLKPMDPDGLSEPYCTLYISSQPQNKQKTTVQRATLAPVWNEEFTFTSNDVADECLTICVWDWEEDKSLLETAGRIRQVKNMAGLKSFVKQVKYGGQSSNGATENTHLLIGKAQVHLKDVMKSETIKWYPIYKRKQSTNEEKKQGSVFVQTHIKRNVTGEQHLEDHERLAYLLFRQYYMTTEMEDAEEVLTWHSIFYNIPRFHRSVYQWLAAYTLHQDEDIQSRLILRALNNITNYSDPEPLPSHIKDRLITTLDDTLNINLKLVKSVHIQIMTKSYIQEFTGIIQQFKKLKELLPIFIPTSLDIKEEIKRSLHEGNLKWCDQILALEEVSSQDEYEIFCGHNQVLNSLLAFLCLAAQSICPAFSKHLQLEVYEIMHKDFEDFILRELEATVKYVCESIQNIFERKQQYNQREEEIGANIFFCYFALQEFMQQGRKNSVEPVPELSEYYMWFKPALHSWLSMATSKATQYINRAVELDNWEPVFPDSHYSSSVIDALFIITEVEKFWESLGWPDPESSKIFINHGLVNSIYNLLHHYGTLVQEAFVRSNTNGVTNKHVIILNNLDYIREKISTELVESLKEQMQDGGMLSPAMKAAFAQIIDKLDQTLIKWVCDPASSALQKMESKNTDVCSKVFNDLDEVIHLLYCKLSEQKLQKLLWKLWNSLTNMIRMLVADNNKSRNFYKSLENLLRDMKELLHGDGKGLSVEELESDEYIKTRNRLQLCAMSTNQLITTYHQRRYKCQEKLSESCGLGMLTIKTSLENKKLHVEVLNGRNLPAADYSDIKKRHKILNKVRNKQGSSDPYVRLELVPRFLSKTKQVFKTSVQEDTLFPIFDESFTLDVPNADSDVWLLASVWDYDKISYDDFLGETLLPLGDVSKGQAEAPQQHLVLTQAAQEVSDIISILNSREEDEAKAFLKKQKKRIVVAHKVLN